MQVNLKSLANSTSGILPFEYSIDLSGEKVNYDFPFKSPIFVKGNISDHAGAVYFDAVCTYTLDVKCARCDYDICVPCTKDVSFMLAMSLEGDDSDSIFVLTSEVFDTDEIIVPELLMDVSMSYLCSEDCLGICPICGKNRNTTQCDCKETEHNSQFLKLRELLK